MDYQQFLEKKNNRPLFLGFEIEEKKLNKTLFDFQKFCVKKALHHASFALFEECGLGKSLQQAEWAFQVVKKHKCRVIIIAPLSVSYQTIEIAKSKMGISINRYEQKDVDKRKTGIWISNYEQIDNILFEMFEGIVLDESSILKSVDGKTKTKLVEQTRYMKFRLCCTATPSPNDDMEICNHAEFLGYGTRMEILATYFVHDGGETSKWRLKGHAKKTFWRWVKTWAIVVTNPSDIGFDGSDFVLPELIINQSMVSVPIKQGVLFNVISVSAIGFNKELRDTMDLRMNAVMDILTNHVKKDQCVIWVKQNVEADRLKELLPDAVDVRGSDSSEDKEKNIIAFINKKIKRLITKKKICGFGMNFQNCHHAIDASIDFSFEGLYQAIRRFYRFGQTKPVTYWIIVTDTMGNVVESIKRKERQFEELKRNLIEL